MEKVLSYTCLGKLLRCTDCSQWTKDEESTKKLCHLLCQCGAYLFEQREHNEQLTEVFVKEGSRLVKVLNTDNSDKSTPFDLNNSIDRFLSTIKSKKDDSSDKNNDKTDKLRRIGTDKEGRTLFLKEIGYLDDNLTEQNENENKDRNEDKIDNVNKLRVLIDQYAEKNDIEPDIVIELKKLPFIISNSNVKTNEKRTKRRLDCFFCSLTKRLAEKMFGYGALTAY